ncbi:MAG: D-cysteine desulfhydrase family protein [Acidimicrobiia bacterium]|nr:D-cysteine desulfhydrase family protein [Acidimicrobiia bacterium]
MGLDRFPRVALGHWPTPLEPCLRLHEAVGGPLVWLKRDDCSGLAFGGNKTRKLEFLLGEALAADASRVVTFGAIQSNHARQTVAACNRVGLACDLILVELVDRATDAYATSGNRLLDDVLGATVHVVPDFDAAAELAAELAAADPARFFVGTGGSTPVGTLGYVAMVAELAAQLDEVGVVPQRVVTATSSGGTAAGLVLGAALGGHDVEVLAAAVSDSADVARDTIDALVGQTALLVDDPLEGEAVLTVDDSCLGEGYGVPTAASQAAIELLARTEGVLLDPVYTAKAFALLLDRLGDWDPDGDVVFVHTGGQPGLFAYGDEF